MAAKPYKFTAPRKAIMLKLISEGKTRSAAMESLGLARQTLTMAMKRDPEEALEAYRSMGIPLMRGWNLLMRIVTTVFQVGVGHELADVVIRVADMAEHYNVTLPYVL